MLAPRKRRRFVVKVTRPTFLPQPWTVPGQRNSRASHLCTRPLASPAAKAHSVLVMIDTRSTRNDTMPRIADQSGIAQKGRNIRTVRLALPLGLVLAETEDGRVFLDEFVEGGNAENSGELKLGDVVYAVSLPFGDACFPVPKEHALEVVEDYIETRGDKELFFALQVYEPSESIEELREMAGLADEESAGEFDEEELLSPEEEMMKWNRVVDQIFIDEYPLDDGDESTDLSEVPSGFYANDEEWEEQRKSAHTMFADKDGVGGADLMF